MGTNQMNFSDGGSDKKTIRISKTAAVIYVVGSLGSILLVGLLVGLVGRPTCNTAVPDTTTTKAPATATATTKAPADTTTKAPATTTTDSVITPNPTPEATTPMDGGIWTNDRLPASLIPIHYIVDLRTDFDFNDVYDAYMFYGSSSVQYLCNTSTEYVILHSFELNYTDNAFHILDESGTEQKIIEQFFYLRNDYLVLQTESACVEGKTYNFTADHFQSDLGDDLDGLYKSEYVNEDGETKVIAVSQMEPFGARRTFPSFDEPALKATFDIILRYRSDQGYFALSNMPIISYQSSMIEGNEWNASIFNTTMIMPTYLLAFTVTDFTYEESSTTTGIQTNIYAKKAAIDNGEGVYSAEFTPKILMALGDEYNIPYEQPKSDQLAAPDFAFGAMENWGLVLYRENLLLWDNMTSSTWSKYYIPSIIAHELAHQWFGNRVTCAWWNEIWLNEGFATYVSYVGVEKVQPEWKTDELFVVDDLQVAFRADDSSTSHALVHPQGYFSSVTYSKGGSVIRMIHDFLGEPTFTQGLTNYLNKFAYGSAKHDDLFQSWIEEANANGLTFDYDLQSIFESWTLQMGYPLVSVTKKDSTTFSVSQGYFLINPNDSPNFDDSEGSQIYRYKWYIPFTYRTASTVGSSDTIYKWMPATDEIVEIDENEDYILANIDAVGLYRVWYEQGIFDAIVAKLNEPTFDEISPQNRAQLIDDAFNLVTAGKTSVTRVFDISSYMYQELTYCAWGPFLYELQNYDYKLSSSPIYVDFRSHVLSLVEPSIYAEYGWDDTNTSDALLMERFTRELAIEEACYYGSEACLGNATEIFHEWMMNPDMFITRTYRVEVYCYGIKESGLDEWNFVAEQYGKTSEYYNRRDLQYGLSCSKDPWILNRYLEWSLDENNVPRSELSSVFSYVAGHEYGKYVALSFAYNNWDAIYNISGYGSNALDSLLSAATRRLSTAFDVDLLESFKSLVSSQAWMDNINNDIATVESNIEWRNKHEADISSWLGSTKYVKLPTPKPRKYKEPEIDDLSNGFMRKYQRVLRKH